jgi:hypothetical protein
MKLLWRKYLQSLNKNDGVPFWGYNLVQFGLDTEGRQVTRHIYNFSTFSIDLSIDLFHSSPKPRRRGLCQR